MDLTETTEELQTEELTLEVARLFPRQGEWTEKDYYSLPETNMIVELSEGRLIITPSPTDKHQRIIGNLYFLIRSFLLKSNLGIIRFSPLDVWLYEGTIRQPDIVFMSNEHKDRITDKQWIIPDLVVEVLSESTAKADKEEKYVEYQKAGVQEYWIVDPSQQTIQIFTLENNAYVQLGKWGVDEIAHSKILAGFNLVVKDIFSE